MDEDDDRNAVLEVRAGTGGEEAALFAMDLFNMYEKFAKLMGWKFRVIDVSIGDAGGYRDASATVSGSAVFSMMKFEVGTHRVQRVPATETQSCQRRWRWISRPSTPTICALTLTARKVREDST